MSLKSNPRKPGNAELALADLDCPTADLLLATLFAWQELEERPREEEWPLPDCVCLDGPTSVRLAGHAAVHEGGTAAARLDTLCRSWCAEAVRTLRDLPEEAAAALVRGASLDRPAEAAALLYACATDRREAVRRSALPLRLRIENAAFRAWRFGVRDGVVPAGE